MTQCINVHSSNRGTLVALKSKWPVYWCNLLELQSNALIKTNRTIDAQTNRLENILTSEAKNKTICDWSVNKEDVRVPSLILWHFILFLFWSARTLPSPRLFCSCQTRPRGVWAQHELAAAGYLQSPAICQHVTNQHFTPTPPRSNWLWRRQKGTWCDGIRSAWKRERGRRMSEENRQK